MTFDDITLATDEAIAHVEQKLPEATVLMLVAVPNGKGGHAFVVRWGSGSPLLKIGLLDEGTRQMREALSKAIRGVPL